MVRLLTPLYKEWNKNSKTIVIMKGSGDRSFCAGGDIRSIYDSVKVGKGSKTLPSDFFAEEYQLNNLIARKEITQVALLNGITMGGGVGLSVHGKYRVATDNTLFAMPETSIGFFCDVGGSYFLPRLQDSLGMYLGLTGGRIKGIDCVAAGIATHYVKQEQLAELEDRLTKAESVDQIEKILNEYSTTTPPNNYQPSEFVELRDQISKIFSKNSVEEIMGALKETKSNTDFRTSGWAKNTLNTLEKNSATSLKVVFKQLNEGKKLSYEEVFKMEYRISQTFMNESPEFFEGVRAALVDKDKNPQWNPSDVSKVSQQDVDKFFKKLPSDKELIL